MQFLDNQQIFYQNFRIKTGKILQLRITDSDPKQTTVQQNRIIIIIIIIILLLLLLLFHDQHRFHQYAYA